MPVYPPPAQVGLPLLAVDTPALLLDLDAFEHNLRALHSRVLPTGVRIRAHGKAHKCPDIAQQQVAAGAVGICCQKVSEAEAFVAGGLTDVLISNQVVGAAKAERVARLALRCKLAVCVDHPLQVEQLGRACAAAGAVLGILIEVDVGQRRCGVGDETEALALAACIGVHPNLKLDGLQAYYGSAQHMRSPEARAQAISTAAAKAARIQAALRQAGWPCETVTGGGTGSYLAELESGVYTEIQPGSYVMMDLDYQRNAPAPGAPELRQALYVLSTVISAHPDRAVLDAGLKALAVDSGPPQPCIEGWKVKSVSDEHTVLLLDGALTPLEVGEQVMLIPGHCDPTVHLHDWIVGHRNGCVEQLWAISARGALA